MRKILTLTLSVLMLFSIIMPVSAFTDISGLKCEEAVKVLSALKLVEGKSQDEFDPEGNLTRAEMATILVRTLCMAEGASGKDIFSDVTSSHWAYAYVAAAYSMGIVNGMDSTTFAPDAPLTYEQAVKMIVGTLGYSVQAEAMGGYPAGYLSKASQLGILKGTSSAGSAISRGTMAVILYNSLDVKLLQRDSYGTENTTYITNDDTLLSRYLKVEKVKGIISANYFTAITTPWRTLRRGEVALGNGIYDAAGTGADNMLGQKVTVYAKEDDSPVPVILAVVPEATLKVVKVPAEDINPNTTVTRLTYEEEGKSRDSYYNIYGSATLILNGVVKPDRTAADLQPETGYVTLIMNDGSGADVLLVESYENHVVDTINTDDCKVYFKDTNSAGSMVVDESDPQTKISFTDSNGEKIGIDDLSEWDILSVSKSHDGKVMRIVKSSETVSGVVTETGTKDAVIGEKTYGIASNLINSTVLKKPAIGMSAEFRLDFMGNIAAVNTDIGSITYGYMVSAGYTKGLDKEPQFKIYTQDAEMKIFNTADKVKVNNSYVQSSELLDPVPTGNPLLSGTAINSQLITFEANEEGLITKINTAEDFTFDYENDRRYDVFSKDFYIDSNSQSDGVRVTYKGGSLRMFAGKLLTRDKTKIFVIPSDKSKDEAFSMLKYTSLLHDTDGGDYRNVSFYDVDENGIVAAMVWDIGGNADAELPLSTNTLGVITEVSEGINEDGETCSFITLINEKKQTVKGIVGEDLQVFFSMAHTDLLRDPMCPNGKRSSKIDPDELNIGDVIQYKLNTNNEFTMLNAVFRIETPGEYDQCWNNYNSFFGVTRYSNYAGVSTAYATVLHVGETIKGEVSSQSNPAVKYERVYPKATVTLLYDTNKKTVKEITSADIHKNDRICSVWRTFYPLIMIVYR